VATTNIFPGEAKSGEILFCPFETKKATFSAKNLIGKFQFSKLRGSWPALSSLFDAHADYHEVIRTTEECFPRDPPQRKAGVKYISNILL